MASRFGTNAGKNVKWLETPNGRVVHEFEPEDDFDEDEDDYESEEGEALAQDAADESKQTSSESLNGSYGTGAPAVRSSSLVSQNAPATATDHPDRSNWSNRASVEPLGLSTDSINETPGKATALTSNVAEAREPIAEADRGSLLRTNSLSWNSASGGPSAQQVSLESVTGKTRVIPASIDRGATLNRPLAAEEATAPLSLVKGGSEGNLTRNGNLSSRDAALEASSHSLGTGGALGPRDHGVQLSSTSVNSTSSSALHSSSSSPVAVKKSLEALSSPGNSPSSPSKTLKSLTKSLKDGKGAIKGMLLKVGKTRNSPTSPAGAFSVPSDRDQHSPSRPHNENSVDDDKRKASRSPILSPAAFLKKVGVASLKSPTKSPQSPAKPVSPTIQVLRVFAGNVMMQAQFVTVVVKPETTVHDLLVSSLRKHLGPSFNVHEWYLSLINGESVEIRLNEGDLVATMLNGLVKTHLPGTSITPVRTRTGSASPTVEKGSETIVTNPIKLIESDDIKFTLNKKVNLFERNCHLMRVFKYEDSGSQQMRMYKTVGILPHLTVKQVISLLRHKFQVSQDPQVGFMLSARFVDKEFDCSPEASISSIMYEQLKRQQNIAEQRSNELSSKQRRSKNELEFVFAPTTDSKFLGKDFVVSAEALSTLEPPSRPSSYYDSPGGSGHLPPSPDSIPLPPTDAQVLAKAAVAEKSARVATGTVDGKAGEHGSPGSFEMQRMEDIIDSLLGSDQRGGQTAKKPREEAEINLAKETTICVTGSGPDLNDTGYGAIADTQSSSFSLERNIPARSASFSVHSREPSSRPQLSEANPGIPENRAVGEDIEEKSSGLSTSLEDAVDSTKAARHDESSNLEAKELPDIPVIDYGRYIKNVYAEDFMLNFEKYMFDSRLRLLKNQPDYSTFAHEPQANSAGVEAFSNLKTLYDTRTVLQEMDGDLTRLLLRSMQIFSS